MRQSSVISSDTSKSVQERSKHRGEQIKSHRNVMSLGWHYWLALLLGTIIAGGFLLAVMPGHYPYIEADASDYLESARNLLAGKGLLVSTLPEQLPQATAPLASWPPGYPVIIALSAKLFGVSPFWVAPRIAWLSWILIPVTLLYALRPFLSYSGILAIGAITMLAPGAVDMAPQAMSDVPFLVFTALSLALFFHGTVVRPIWHLVFLSGIAGAAAYSIRYVGLALFAAIPLGCLIFVLTGHASKGVAVRTVVLWLSGAALLLIPIEYRNLAVFGTLQPYHLPPSTLGLGSNIHYYIIALFDDLSGRPELKHDFLWNNTVLSASCVVLLAAIILFRNALIQYWKAIAPQQRQVIILILCNGLAGSAIVILARTRYQWGELINTRHLMQYDWMVFACAALLISPLAQKSRRVAAVVVVLILALFGLRLGHALTEIEKDRVQYAASRTTYAPSQLANPGQNEDHTLMVQRLRQDSALLSAIRSLPRQTILLSDRYEVLRVETGRPVTRLLIGEDCKIPQQISAAVRDVPALMLMFPDQALIRSGCWQRLVAASQNQLLPIVRPYLSVLTAEHASQFK